MCDLDHKKGWMAKLSFQTAVLEKILESPLYNKEIKPVSLKGSQPLTPAVLAEPSTEGLKVERMDASTAKVPNHGSSKQFVAPPMENLWKAEGSGGGGWLRDPLGPPLTK